jgi:hypothetical protein
MSYTEYYTNNNQLIKEWRNEEGILHREDGPCYIRYFNNKSISYESYQVSGLFHRKDGPARIWYEVFDGFILKEEFWFHGEPLGQNKEGFWICWDLLSEEERKHPGILKSLIRYSSS